MNGMKNLLVKLSRDEDGAALVEYGLLVALIAVGCVAALTLLGGNLKTMFTNVAGKIPTT
jgi:pilus assembly protein Flp/PilA